MTVELEKEYVKRQLESLKKLTGSYPVGWYYGALSPCSKAIIHEVFEEMDIPLLYESDAYCDDVPFWVDVPAEKDLKKPKGMLMIPYRYCSSSILSYSQHIAFDSKFCSRKVIYTVTIVMMLNFMHHLALVRVLVSKNT